MQKVIITGAAGFCARHLVSRLRRTESVFIYGTDIGKAKPDNMSLDSYCQVDITDPEQVKELIRQFRPDWIFHLAGLVGNANDADIYRVNVSGTINLLDAYCRFAPEASLLLVGSAAEYGSVTSDLLPVTEELVCKPVGAYGISKYAVTMAGLDLASRHNKKIVIARPFNIIGPGISSNLVLGAILNRIKLALTSQVAPVVKIGNVASARDFIAVEDVVDAYVRMIKGNFWGKIFNICSGQPYTIQSLIDKLVNISTRQIAFEIDPGLYRSTDPPIFYGSCEKARLAFNFNPNVSIESALASAWNYVIKEVENCEL
ncbi:NAD-dependent epimerase/dehydratase family protein [Trichlorobacter ammonificans]|uniref:GDP-6-deoxy-D-mannose reductase n=1 Tax=Trichlorobacter ammonificans TaxID=2916410 RepID=A0ABM9DAT5_9BACT|nr:NAD-dependent epimerase/dehydratase family protein [Trichlorobacter ammonificans]CAH2032344.1 putative GDP-6-deoxy-D-mannose reductase [Trichlorobacter ammonificans]